MHVFLEELDGLFAEREVARAWLDQPLAMLEGQTPRAMILAGCVDRVVGFLYALNAGVAL